MIISKVLIITTVRNTYNKKLANDKQLKNSVNIFP